MKDFHRSCEQLIAPRRRVAHTSLAHVSTAHARLGGRKAFCAQLYVYIYTYIKTCVYHWENISSRNERLRKRKQPVITFFWHCWWFFSQDVGDILKMVPFLMNSAHMEVKNIARSFENKQLRQQNARLEGLIREYVRNKTVTSETLQDRFNNPLLVMKGPTYVMVDRYQAKHLIANTLILQTAITQVAL